MNILRQIESAGAKCYYSPSCGFCHKQLEILGLNVETVDNSRWNSIFINCKNPKNKSVCDVSGFPTWKCPGKVDKPGCMSIDVLQQWLNSEVHTNTFGRTLYPIMYLPQTSNCFGTPLYIGAGGSYDDYSDVNSVRSSQTDIGRYYSNYGHNKKLDTYKNTFMTRGNTIQLGDQSIKIDKKSGKVKISTVKKSLKNKKK